MASLAEVAPTEPIYAVTVRSSNMRKGASSTADIVQKYTQGTRVELLERIDEDGVIWYRVRETASGQEGYMRDFLLDIDGDTSRLASNLYPIEISKLTMRTRSASLKYSFTVKNNTGKTIEEITYYARFFDSNNELIYGFLADIDGYEKEEYSWLLSYKNGLKTGKKQSYDFTETYFPSAFYSKVKNVELAVTAYRTTDGEVIRILEDSFVWVNSNGSKTVTPKTVSVCLQPDKEIMDKSNSFALGSTGGNLYNYQAPYYMRRAGVWISKIIEGSIVENYGLKVGDVIVAADGIRWSDDYYIIERAKAKMADGETVEFIYFRNGIEHSVQMSLYD
jgi:hypothetical protein